MPGQRIGNIQRQRYPQTFDDWHAIESGQCQQHQGAPTNPEHVGKRSGTKAQCRTGPYRRAARDYITKQRRPSP